jgi:lysophospholipase L1-like esterase
MSLASMTAGAISNPVPFNLPQQVSVVIGNSISTAAQVQGAGLTTGLNTIWQTLSEPHAANVFAGSPMRFMRMTPTTRGDVHGIYGFSGATSASIIADIAVQLWAPLAAAGISPNLVFILALFENDIVQDVATATSLANLNTLIADIKSRYGAVRVLIGTPHPSTQYSTPSRVTAYQALRAAVVALADGITVFSARLDSYEDTGAPAQPLSGYTLDGLHPNALGATANARHIKIALASIASSFTSPLTVQSNNLTLTGAIAATGINTSGTMPTSMVFSGAASGTFIATALNPGFQISAFAAPNASPTRFQFLFNCGPIALSGPTQLSPFFVVQIISGAANLRNVELCPRLADGSGAPFIYYLQAVSINVDPVYLDGDILTLREPPITAVSGAIASVTNYCTVTIKAAGGTVVLKLIQQGVEVVV